MNNHMKNGRPGRAAAPRARLYLPRDLARPWRPWLIVITSVDVRAV